jgi:hypothetical protein
MEPREWELSCQASRSSISNGSAQPLHSADAAYANHQVAPHVVGGDDTEPFQHVSHHVAGYHAGDSHYLKSLSALAVRGPAYRLADAVADDESHHNGSESKVFELIGQGKDPGNTEHASCRQSGPSAS